jgi:hypothetical protein
VSDPLSTLESDLGKLATADTADPQNGTASATSALTAAQDILALLADQSLVGTSIGGAVGDVYTAIASAITDDVVNALQKIAGELDSLASTLGTTGGSDAATALLSLQNVLQTAQSLVPGGSSAAASALAATSQFATLFGNLLSDVDGHLDQAADKLYEIAQQLTAIATAFTAAAQGNP